VVVGLVASLSVPLAGDGTAVRADSPPSSRFVPTSPCRLADSRDGDHAVPVGEHRWRVDVRGRCGVPEGATAIAASIVAISHDEPGWITAYAARRAAPPVSLVNYGGGDVRSNGSVLQIDDDGVIVEASAAAEFVLDVTGFFVPSLISSRGRYQSPPRSPSRCRRRWLRMRSPSR
jgi:hypothetical protein